MKNNKYDTISEIKLIISEVMLQCLFSMLLIKNIFVGHIMKKSMLVFNVGFDLNLYNNGLLIFCSIIKNMPLMAKLLTTMCIHEFVFDHLWHIFL
jgi:hypothetical protein